MAPEAPITPESFQCSERKLITHFGTHSSSPIHAARNHSGYSWCTGPCQHSHLISSTLLFQPKVFCPVHHDEGHGSWFLGKYILDLGVKDPTPTQGDEIALARLAGLCTPLRHRHTLLNLTSKLNPDAGRNRKAQRPPHLPSWLLSLMPPASIKSQLPFTSLSGTCKCSITSGESTT